MAENRAKVVAENAKAAEEANGKMEEDLRTDRVEHNHYLHEAFSAAFEQAKAKAMADYLVSLVNNPSAIGFDWSFMSSVSDETQVETLIFVDKEEGEVTGQEHRDASNASEDTELPANAAQNLEDLPTSSKGLGTIFLTKFLFSGSGVPEFYPSHINQCNIFSVFPS